MTRIGSLFTGYAGLDMAVEQLLDTETVWHCDDDPAATALLAHHYPTVPNLGDITTVDWHRVAAEQPIDVLTGGFPCTDVSAAGRRAGLMPDNNSGLWAHMARAIAVLKPRLVVAENVRGLLSSFAHRDVEPDEETLGDGDTEPVLRALGAVLGDLAELGFDARWHGLQASDVGAPHARFRVFLIAWPAADTEGDGRHQGRPEPGGQFGGHDAALASGGNRPRDDSPRVHRGTGNDADLMAWGPYAPAIERWQRAIGRAAPEPTVPGKRGGNPVLNPAFVEWMQGLPAGWVTDVPGIERTDALRLLGNGVIPQQAGAALTTLLDRAMPDREVPAA